MNDNQLRQIIREEIARSGQSGRFDIRSIDRHKHNGIDSPRINAGDLVPGRRTSGSVTFSSTGDYILNTNFEPASVVFYGNPYHTTAGVIDRHTFVFGQAALGQNLYLQPQTTSSVQTGGTLGIVQTSTMFMGLNSGAGTSFQAIASQTHLIEVEESGGVKARATITAYGPNSITITVSTLDTGWTIVGNYFIS